MRITRLEERTYSQEERDAMAKSGVAMSDGSYPIPDKAALQEAVQSYGRSPDQPTKAHIVKRARALGAMEMLPMDWEGSTKKPIAASASLLERLQEAINHEVGLYVRNDEGGLVERELPVVGVYENPHKVVFAESGQFWQAGFEYDRDGKVTLLEESEVSGIALPLPPVVNAASLVESVSAEGAVWDMVMIQAGKTRSRPARFYTPAALREAAPLMEGKPAFKNHATKRQKSERPERSIEDKAGQWSNVRYEPYTDEAGQLQEGIRGRVTVVDPAVRTKLLEAYRLGMPTFLGVSIVGEGSTKIGVVGGERMEIVESIHRIDSIDFVTSGAAGGRIVSLVASDPGEGGEMTEAEIQELIAKERQAAVAEAQAIWTAASGSAPSHPPAAAGGGTGGDGGTHPPTAVATPPPSDPAPSDPAPAASTAVATVAPPAPAVAAVVDPPSAAPELVAVQESMRAMQTAMATQLTESALSTSKLSPPGRDIVKARVKSLSERRPVEAGEITVFIQEALVQEAAVHDWYAGRGDGPNAGGFRGPLGFHQTDDQRAKHKRALLGLMSGHDEDGVKPFRSLKEAWSRYTGNDIFDSSPVAIFRDFFGSRYDSEVDHERMLQEGLQTADWAQVFADVIYIQAMRSYREMAYSTMWQPLVSQIQDVPDFQDQHWVRTGGYGNLPTVGERETYPELSSPGDEEVKFAVEKRGGLEDITWEMVVNDRIGQVRRIPQSLGRSAARTLYTFVLELITTNPTMAYDSTALYHANHNNLGNTSLNLAGLNDMFKGMRAQTAFGESSEILGVRNIPKFILAAPDNEQLLNRLVNPSPGWIMSATANAETTFDPAAFAGRGLVPMVVDMGIGTYTDATAYIGVANPMEVETMTVGFLNGRRDPEIFVQDQQNVGAVMTSDKFTTKIRHVYGGAILDHRSFYLGHA